MNSYGKGARPKQRFIIVTTAWQEKQKIQLRTLLDIIILLIIIIIIIISVNSFGIITK